MKSSPTYAEIAADWRLWVDYVDPSGIGTREEFDAMPMDARIHFIESCFGKEEAPNCLVE